VRFHGGSWIVYGLAGAGTVGATLRVHIERYEPPERDLGADAQKMFADLIALSRSLAEIEPRTGRKERDDVGGSGPARGVPAIARAEIGAD
jgi:phosphoglucomutase